MARQTIVTPQHRCHENYWTLFSMLATFLMGMIVMLWLSDWNTQGYVCTIQDTDNICRKRVYGE